jgi:putative peptide zinc metalloprotease protein
MMTARALPRRLATVGLAIGLVLGMAPMPLAAAGDSSGPERFINKVHAFVNRDDRYVTRVRWQDDRSHAGTVTAGNEAVAYASCRGCGATAVAFQVLLAGRATDLTVTNDAVAVNEQCEECATFAGAYQFVVVGNGDLRLTKAGAAELRRLRGEAHRLRAARLQPAEAQVRADALAEQVLQVLLTEVVPDSRAASPQGDRPPGPGASDADGSDPALASAEPSPEASDADGSDPALASALASPEPSPEASLTQPDSAGDVSVTLNRDVDLAPTG